MFLYLCDTANIVASFIVLSTPIKCKYTWNCHYTGITVPFCLPTR